MSHNLKDEIGDYLPLTDTKVLDYLEMNKDRFIAFAPSGQWGLFMFDMRPQVCYGGTIRQCVERAIKYDFPSSVGYAQMLADESVL